MVNCVHLRKLHCACLLVLYAYIYILKAENPHSWLRRQLVVSRSVAEQVASLTAGQRESQLWCSIRKLQLTASNFGVILGPIRRNMLVRRLHT